MPDTSVINDIIDTINTNLVVAMQNFIDQTDVTKAGLVRAGLLQDDPVEPSVSVLTHTNDPDEENGWDSSIVVGPGEDLNTNIPGSTIGGEDMWWYRFTTEVVQFWTIGTSREDARRYAAIVLSRAKYTIRKSIFEVSADTFGNYPLMATVVSTRMVEAGGGDQFIWRTKLRWQCLVSCP